MNFLHLPLLALLVLAQISPLLAQEAVPAEDNAGRSTNGEDDIFGDNSEPVDISAEDGLEWRRSEHLYIARGKAKAIRGKGTAEADVLMAFYDDTGKKLQRLVGQGNVVLTSGGTVMTGEFGDYDVNTHYLKLSGMNLGIKTKNETITATKFIHYWTQDKIIKTQGRSKIVDEDTTITSNVATIYLHKDGENKGKAYQVESEGNVKITTPKQVATAKKMLHNVEKDITVLIGSVYIVEGDREVRGEKAEIDHKSGISRIISGGQRVKVNINPKNPPAAPQDDEAPTP